MEWGKAKNYLICMLIGVNIFLFGYNIFNSYSWRISKETLKDTEKILSDRGVVLEVSLPSRVYPRTKAQMRDFDVDISRFKAGLSDAERIDDDGSRIEYFSFETRDRANIKNRVNIKNMEQVKNFLIKWMKNKGIYHNGWQISEYKYIQFNGNFYEDYSRARTYFKYCTDLNNSSPDNTNNSGSLIQNDNEDSKMLALVLTQKYKNYMIYSNQVYFLLDNNGVRYFCSPKILKKIVSTYSDKNIPIIPAHQVLIANFTKPETIAGLDIGFSSDFNSSDSLKVSEEYPVWRVTSKNGKVFFFDAIEGKIKQ